MTFIVFGTMCVYWKFVCGCVRAPTLPFWQDSYYGRLISDTVLESGRKTVYGKLGPENTDFLPQHTLFLSLPVVMVLCISSRGSLEL